LAQTTQNQGCLYLVATPIGNLEDITLRALKVLRQVEWVAAEDTRHTRKLLTAHRIQAKTMSYREQNHRSAAGRILQSLESGKDVALVSDAGTPGLSDPGQGLVDAVLRAGFRVIPVPGPAAAVASLTASGLPSDRFLFLGFLPRKRPALERLAAELASEPGTLVIYESPKRLAGTLSVLADVWGARDAVVVRELTKVHETFHRGTLPELAAEFKDGTRGEVTLLISGTADKPETLSHDWITLIGALGDGRGLPPGEIASLLGRLSGLGRNAVYRVVREGKGGRKDQNDRFEE
jgi:16S rRNA (cytidine1402-2'-O)-methyltransferase